MTNLPKERTNPDQEISSNELTVASNSEIVNDYDIDSFLEKRAEFITKVKAIMIEGKDFHVIQGKKSLAKGGAEKIASIFGWQATFTKDEDVSSAFKLEGLIAFKCTLTKAGAFVGEGRGAATIQKNNGDPNKTIKMAQKSAFVDAVLRASGLSDFFTQDLQDLEDGKYDKVIQTPTTNGKEYIDPEKPNSAPSEALPKKTINGGSQEYPISQAQIGYLKGLYKKKTGEDIPSEDLEKLNRKQASEEIERLLKLEDQEIKTIQIE